MCMASVHPGSVYKIDLLSSYLSECLIRFTDEELVLAIRACLSLSWTVQVNDAH